MPYKTCGKCSGKNGVRTLVCRHCSFPFTEKSHSSKSGSQIGEEWKELKRGDLIKIKQGSGPYYLLSNGEREYLSISGKVRVLSIEALGFWAVHDRLRDKRGEFFVYMGATCRSPVDRSLIRKRHKIIRMKEKAR
jgi:hypothetical protein